MCNKPEVCFIGTSLCDKLVGNTLSRQGCLIWNGEAFFLMQGALVLEFFSPKNSY